MTDIDVLLQEHRKFPPPPAFQSHAHIGSPEIYARAAEDFEAFWAECARELDWSKPFSKVLDWKPPHATWFADGELNVSENCVDRHARGARRHKPALVWEGEPGDTKTLTYAELLDQVSRFATVLDSLGVRKGDRVAIYLPMIPEAAIAMLGCARVGAVHSVVFGGFSAESLRDRIVDAQAKVLITADGGFRRGNVVPLKKNADDAMAGTPTIEHVVVVRRTEEPIGGSPAPMKAGRDQWWHELMSKASATRPPTPMNAEDILFTLYTSGTTGKPKGIVHTTGGYLTQCAYTSKMIFDLKEEDVYWCTADVGWVTGHSYIVCGPLANGATCLMYEGAPDWPAKDRFWELCEKYGVTIFYTAPTAIRAFMKWGDAYPAKYDLSQLRLIGTVGEPINPEAWMWYYEHIGHGLVMASSPPPTPIGFAASSRSSAKIPGSGTVALPGVVSVIPGSGEIIAAPVSVCHHVSTIGHLFAPMFSRYHIHASGLIGSPTVPMRRSFERSCFCGCCSPHFMKARIAVGAV